MSDNMMDKRGYEIRGEMSDYTMDKRGYHSTGEGIALQLTAITTVREQKEKDSQEAG